MTWLYQTQPIDDLPEDCIGFVYLIQASYRMTLHSFDIFDYGN